MNTEPENEFPLRCASDRELIVRFSRRHDEDCFRELVSRYAELVWGVSLRVLRNAHDAEDVFQDTFLTLFQKGDKLWVRQSIGSWLYGVAFRKARRMAIKRNRRREEPLVADSSSDRDVLMQICARHEQLTFDEELESLPEKYREPLVLHFLVGKTVREIADQLGISARAVEGRLRRGKQRLRVSLSCRGVTMSAAIMSLVLSSHKSLKAETIRALFDSIVSPATSTHTSDVGVSTDPLSFVWCALKEKAFMYRCISISLAALVLLIVLVGTSSYRGTTAAAHTIVSRTAWDESHLHLLSSNPSSKTGTLYFSADGANDTDATLVSQESEKSSAVNQLAQSSADEDTRGAGKGAATGSQEHSISHLRRLMIALHDYRESHGHFPPPAVCDDDGAPLLSWRVLLLPFLNENTTYKAFNLHEPWDSPQNKKLVELMPDVFSSRSTKKRAGTTNYLAILGPDTVFSTSDTTGTAMAKIADGLSHTIMLVETPDQNSAVWSKPADVVYQPSDPRQGLLGAHENGVLVAFADGTIRFLPKTVRDDTLNALVNIADGKPIDESQLQPVRPMQTESLRRLRDFGALLNLDGEGWISSAQLLARPYSRTDQDDDLRTLAQMEGRSRLKTLYIKGSRFSDASLEMIGKLRFVTSLHLSWANMNGRSLSSLKPLRSLRSLSLVGLPIDDEGLAHLEALQRLETLRIGECTITDAAIVHLKKLNTLKRLTIHSTQITATGIEQLREELPACTISLR